MTISNKSSTSSPILDQQDLVAVRECISEIRLTRNYGNLPLWFIESRWFDAALTTTDQAIADYLRANPPRVLLPLEAGIFVSQNPIFAPEAVDILVRQSSNLLDRCLARRQEIIGLEAQAITTLLDYLLAESLQPGTLRLAKMALKATRKQGSAQRGDADEAVLVDQDALQTKARLLRLAMHNADGHPLNFGQRLEVLRELQGADVRAIYERLDAARIGMSAYGLANEIHPVPSWSAMDWNNLTNLVRWTREALLHREDVQAKERTYLRVFYLGGDGIYGPGSAALAAQFSQVGDSEISFSFSPSDFLEGGIPRVVSMGLYVAFRENEIEYKSARGSSENRAAFDSVDVYERARRRQWRLSGTLAPPVQRANLEGASAKYEWSCLPWQLDGSIAVLNELDSLDVQPGAIPPWLGINPIGEWKLILKDELLGPSERWKLSMLDQYLNGKLVQPADLIVASKLAQPSPRPQQTPHVVPTHRVVRRKSA